MKWLQWRGGKAPSEASLLYCQGLLCFKRPIAGLAVVEGQRGLLRGPSGPAQELLGLQSPLGRGRTRRDLRKPERTSGPKTAMKGNWPAQLQSKVEEHGQAPWGEGAPL